jgi:hypothetical protein
VPEVSAPDAGIRQRAEQLMESLPREADRQVISDLLVKLDRTAQEQEPTADEATILTGYAKELQKLTAALAQAQAERDAALAALKEARDLYEANHG